MSDPVEAARAALAAFDRIGQEHLVRRLEHRRVPARMNVKQPDARHLRAVLAALDTATRERDEARAELAADRQLRIAASRAAALDIAEEVPPWDVIFEAHLGRMASERDAILTRLDERAAWLIDECRKGGTCYEERDQAIYSAKIAREAMMAVRKDAADKALSYSPDAGEEDK